MAGLALAIPPPLHEGDRLSPAEFLRRWEAMPELRHAELLDGVVFMASPIGEPHSYTHSEMNGWLWTYKDATPGCESGNAGTWLMGRKDVAQPDLTLRILPENGGQSSRSGLYCAGAPELILEVSGSSTSRDLGIKIDLYSRTGVLEYITVLLHSRQVIWRRLARGRYDALEPDADGWLRSVAFPGLWLDPSAVWDRRRSLRSALDLGLRSPGHAGFVERLAKAASREQ